MKSYDLFVIGAGSGGVRAARMAAATGAKVAIAEEYRFGGTCVIRGCVPKKLFSYAAHFGHDFEDAKGFGWTSGTSKFDWKTLITNKDKEIDRLEDIYGTLLGNAGVDSYLGRATLVDQSTVDVTGEKISANKILIATGGRPWMPTSMPGINYAFSSNEAFHLEELPKSIAIAGAGYIAVEFAGIFNGLGVETHLLYRKEEPMREFDVDIRRFLMQEMEKKGIHMHAHSEIERIDQGHEGHLHITTKSGQVDVSALMMAAGRIPNTENLGLETVGVQTNAKGAIEVDQHFQTSVPNVFALGDVIDRVQLTPVAINEAMVFVDTQFKGNLRAMDYENIATAVFSNPPIGTVGLTEKQAREKYGDVTVYMNNFRPMKYSLTNNTERGLMKLIVDSASDRIVGLHMIGVDAPEITQGFAVAIKMGATKSDFDATVGIHPTAAEEFVTMREPVAS